MKALLYKARLLIIIYSMSGCLLTLASAAIVKHHFGIQNDEFLLSEDYVIGAIQSVYYDNYNEIAITQVLNKLKKN